MCTCDILCFPSTFKFSTSSFFFICSYVCAWTHTHVLQDEYWDPRTTLGTNLQLLRLIEANGHYCTWIYEGFSDVKSGHRTFVASSHWTNPPGCYHPSLIPLRAFLDIPKSSYISKSSTWSHLERSPFTHKIKSVCSRGWYLGERMFRLSHIVLSSLTVIQ